MFALVQEDQGLDHEAAAKPDSQDNDYNLQARPSNTLTRIASRISNVSDVEPAPDGGLKAWTQCGMAWLTVFATWGFTNSFGTFETYYTSSLALQPSTVSWIGSIQVWILFFTSTFSGRALDAGLFLPMFALGATVHLLGVFTTSVSTKYWHLLLSQGVATGLGNGIVFCPALALCATYFSTHRGLALAIASTGNSVGGMIYPIIVTHLLPKIGFGWTVRVLGFINIAFLATVLAFMRPRLPPRVSGPIVDWSAFRETAYSCFTFGMFCFFWAIYFTFYYIASYGRDVVGLSYNDSVVLLIIFNGSGVPARIAAGYLADRYFGALNTFVPLFILNAILAFSWLGVSGGASLYAYVAIYGLTQSALQALLPTCISSLTPDVRKTGVRFGMAWSVMSFAGLTGPPIGGALLRTDHGSWMPAQVWAGVSMLLGAALVTAARMSRFGLQKVKC